MNGREIYEAIYAGERPDYLPVSGIWPWEEARERWQREGLPEGENPNTVLGLTDPHDAWQVGLPLNLNMVPTFPIEIREMTAEAVVLVDEFGVTKRLLRGDFDRTDGYKTGAGNTSSMAHWLDFPVKDMRSWKAIYEARFRPDLTGRLPEDWPEARARLKEQAETHLVCLWGFPFFGFFGPLRELMGLEGLCYAMADDPTLIHTIVADLASFFVETIAQVVPQVRLDSFTFFEDMCATKAPLVSPAGFREFFAPGYRAVINAAHDLGVRWPCVDTDGNCWNLIPEFLACGVAGIHPCEVQAAMDVAALREAYPTLNLNGGIDKRALAAGPAAIDAELRRTMSVAWSKSRYTPNLDHCAPPDISWDNMRYFAERYFAWCEHPEGPS